MTLAHLLALLEVLRKQPTWGINGLESALKYSPDALNNWSVDLLGAMAITLTVLEVEVAKTGLELPGVQADIARLKKIPAIYDVMHPKPKKGKK